MEVFGLMFAVSFVALLTTLVVLSIRKNLYKQSNVAKGNKYLSWISTMLGKQERVPLSKKVSITREQLREIGLNQLNSYMRSYDLDTSWHRKEINETQEKWKESLPKHKTRIKARNKRKQRNKR